MMGGGRWGLGDEDLSEPPHPEVVLFEIKRERARRDAYLKAA